MPIDRNGSNHRWPCHGHRKHQLSQLNHKDVTRSQGGNVMVEYIVITSFLLVSWFTADLFIRGAESYQRGYFQVLGGS